VERTGGEKRNLEPSAAIAERSGRWLAEFPGAACRRCSDAAGRAGSEGQSSNNFANLSSIPDLDRRRVDRQRLYRVDAQERAVYCGSVILHTRPATTASAWPIERKDHRQRLASNTAWSTTPACSTSDTNLVEVNPRFNTSTGRAQIAVQGRDVEDTLTQVGESAMREAVGQASLERPCVRCFDHRARQVF